MFPDQLWIRKTRIWTRSSRAQSYMASSFLDNSPTTSGSSFQPAGKCTIRIFSLGGNLVNVLNHVGINRGRGDYTDWDRLTRASERLFGIRQPWRHRALEPEKPLMGIGSRGLLYHVTDERERRSPVVLRHQLTIGTRIMNFRINATFTRM